MGNSPGYSISDGGSGMATSLPYGQMDCSALARW
jgi:hypothetical protein